MGYTYNDLEMIARENGTTVDDLVKAKASYAPDAPWASYDEAIEFYKKYGDGKTPVASVGSPTAKDDTTWKIYEQSRRKLAQDSAEHVLGVYSQNTGGRANSYAVTAAANASNEILSTLPQEKLNWEAQQQSMKAATFNQQLAVAKQKADFGSYGELASLLGLSEEQVAANYGSVGNDVMTQILEAMIKDGDYEAALRFAGIYYDPNIFAPGGGGDDSGGGGDDSGGGGNDSGGGGNEFADIFAKYPDGVVPQEKYDELVSKHGKGAVDGAGIKVGKAGNGGTTEGGTILTAQALGYIYETYPDGVVDNKEDWDDIVGIYNDFTLVENGVKPSGLIAKEYLAAFGVSPILLNEETWNEAKRDRNAVRMFYTKHPEVLNILAVSRTYDEFVVRLVRAAKDGTI